MSFKSKKRGAMCIMFILVMLASAMSYAAESGCNSIVSKHDAELALKKVYPKLTYESFKDSPAAGIFEVVSNGDVIYYQPPDMFFFGEIAKNGKSLTSKRRDELSAEKVKNIDLKKALKIGSGKKTVIEITDPDCPFCRRSAEYLNGRKDIIKDITRYVFFWPLPFHPDAPKKAKYILCSSDPDKAFNDIYSGKLDGKDIVLPAGCDNKAEDILKEQHSIVSLLNVKGTPTYFIEGKRVDGANTELIEQLITDKK